jgi:DNA invertase Pin-like site-specific DNA recombinase
MIDTQPRICFSYLRFSRTEQAKGNSTKRQTDLRENYCARRNLILDDSRQYEDRGVSGFHGKNLVEGHLSEFLDLVKRGQIPVGSVLLIESIDRFSRDQIIPARNALENLLRAGIEVHTLQPERIYNRESLKSPYELIGMILEFSRAHEYSQQLVNRLTAAWSGKREKARDYQTPLSKRPPSWLKVVSGKYEIIPERAEVVELIYRLSADGLGVNLITRELIRRKIPSFTSGPWGEAYVAKILLGEAPIGHHVPRRIDPATKQKLPTEKIENLFPAVISETLNAQAKVAMRQRKNKGGRVEYDGNKIHPFSGLLETHTGAPLHVKYRKHGRKSPRMVAYLVDQATHNSYPLDSFEFITLGWLVGYEPAPVRNPNGEITTLEEKITKLEYKIQTLKDKINAGEEFESFLELLANAEKERKSTSERLEQVRAIEPMERGFVIINSIFERLSPAPGQPYTPPDRELDLQLRAVLRRIISRIELTIGSEHRFWQNKSLLVTVTFRNGTRAEFAHQPC